MQGMNSSIVKMKEEGDDRYKQFNERITNIEKILDMDEKYENRSEVIQGEHVDENQGKAVVTGFHSETTESEVIIRSANMLKKELRGRKIKTTRSMDAGERFHNKRMGVRQILFPHETQCPTRINKHELDNEILMKQWSACREDSTKWKPEIHQIPRF